MSDLNTRMPSGSDVNQRTDEQPAFSEDLLEFILCTANISAAWKRVRANKGAAGIDDFPTWAKDGNWLRQRMLDTLQLRGYSPKTVTPMPLNH